MKREAKWQVLWTNYLRSAGDEGYGFYELKQVSGLRYSYSKFEPHQLQSLLALEVRGLVWKLSDSDIRKKPIDCMSTPPLYAYVVIKYKPAFVAVRVSDIIEEIRLGHSDYLHYDRACEIAKRIVKV